MKVELLFADVTYLCLITVFLPITMYAIAIGYLFVIVVIVVLISVIVAVVIVLYYL